MFVSLMAALSALTNGDAATAQPVIRNKPPSAQAPSGPPKAPPSLPPTVPPPAPTPPKVVQAPTAGAPIQTKKPLIAAITRATPSVVMTAIAAGPDGSTTFEKSRMRARIQRAAIAPPPLPATVGSNGPALQPSNKVVVDIDGRTVAAADYQGDTYALEDYLNTRGVTQRTKERTRRMRDIKRKVPRASLPGGAGLLRPTNVGTLMASRPPVGLTAKPIQTLAQASNGLWERGESTTLDDFKSVDEQKKASPDVPTKPKEEATEQNRPAATSTWYYRSGGDVGLDIASDGTFSAGQSARSAESRMTLSGHAAGLEFTLAELSGKVSSSAPHVHRKGQTPLFTTTGTPASLKSEGALKIMGIQMAGAPGVRAGNAWAFSEPGAWRLADSWKVTATVPVAMFTAVFSLEMGYEVGALTALEAKSNGLDVRAEVGPSAGAYVELTAGVGIAGFSVGVGGHVALLGSKDGQGPGKVTRVTRSFYEEDGLKQHLQTELGAQLFALSGDLFAFIDTWWERYDTTIFDWTGIDLMAGANLGTSRVDTVWGTFRVPDYGALKEIREFACRQKPYAQVFPLDWRATARTRAQTIADGCEIVPGTEEHLLGYVASKFNPDTVPIVECAVETAWGKFKDSEVLTFPVFNVPVGPNVPVLRNEFLRAVWSGKWDGSDVAPTEEQIMAEAKATCEEGRAGAGQRITVLRVAGYAFKTGGQVNLTPTKVAKARELFRCAFNYDWFVREPTNGTLCPGGPAGYPNSGKSFYILE